MGVGEGARWEKEQKERGNGDVTKEPTFLC